MHGGVRPNMMKVNILNGNKKEDSGEGTRTRMSSVGAGEKVEYEGKKKKEGKEEELRTVVRIKGSIKRKKNESEIVQMNRHLREFHFSENSEPLNLYTTGYVKR